MTFCTYKLMRMMVVDPKPADDVTGGGGRGRAGCGNREAGGGGVTCMG